MDEDGIGPGPSEGGVPVADGDAGLLISDEFADEPEQPPHSHRAGMLAGLAVVGLLLVVLVAFAPGGSKPRLPAQTVHDAGPVPSGGPETAAPTAPSTPSTSPTTTSSVPGGSATRTTRTSHRAVSPPPPATVSLVVTPGRAVAPTTTTPAAPVTTTSPSHPPPTRRRPPCRAPRRRPGLRRRPPRRCLLGILCN